ncbi:MAG: BlaI/MecI/CopY family transcriptional regulator [Acidimicrobiales bacterium]
MVAVRAMTVVDAVRDLYRAHWGEPSRRARFEVGEFDIEVYKWAADANPEGVALYATVGASGRPMVGRDVNHRVEFFLGLVPERDDVRERDADAVLGPLEAGVMAVVWKAQAPVSVREVLERLNESRPTPLAYTTVMTVMARLAEKDILRRELNGRGYSYSAAVPDVAAIAVRNVVRDFGEARWPSSSTRPGADPKLLRELRRMLEDEG